MDNDYRYVIKVCYNYQFQLIYLNEVSLDTFLDACKKAFKISFDKAIVEMADRDGAPISKNKFACTIEKLSTCNFFCITLSMMDTSAAIVTPTDVEAYLISVGATHLLEQRKRQLTIKFRRQLILHVFNFQTSRFGANPSDDQKCGVHSAVVFLFPSLKSSDPKNSTKIVKGYLDVKMKNVRTAAKKRNMNESDASDATNTNGSVISYVDIAECEKTDVELLKLTVVNESNMSYIEAKLQSTLSYRFKLMEIPELDLKEYFPYFFSNPTLILLDFSLRYKDIDCDAFLDSWPTNNVRLNDILTNQYETSVYTMWSQDIQDLLILLKLLPAKSNGRNLLSVQAFNKATEKLFVFRKSHLTTDQLIEKDNKFPYIIACGDSQNEISHYYIEVEKYLMNVPEEFSAAQTFDLLFKVHKVFNLNFDPNLQPMMKFLQNFIYGLNSKRFKPTNKMNELFKSLSNPMEQ